MYKALYITNFLSTLNDNYQKMLGMLVVTGWVQSDLKPLVISITGAALVLPYIFCSPLANRVTQIYGKKKIVRASKLLEIPIVLLAVIGFLMKDPTLFEQHQWSTPVATTLVILAIFFIGIQSSMYSPAKYGLIRDIGGVENVSQGMGGMESLSFLGMLLATAMAALMVDNFSPLKYSSLLIILAISGYISSIYIKANEINTDEKESLNPFAYLKSSFQMAKKYDKLNFIIFILSIFWWFATTIQLCVIVYCQDVLGLEKGEPGMIMCVAAIGISIGCILSGKIGNKNPDEIKRAPIYGILLAGGLIGLFLLTSEQYILFGVIIFIVGVCGGMFKVPLDTEIQRVVSQDKLNTILAYFNQISFLFMLLASITYYSLTLVLPQKYIFLMLAIVISLTSIWLWVIKHQKTR